MQLRSAVPILRIFSVGEKHRYARPGLEQQPWGARTVSISDPFGIRLTFTEFNKPR